MTVDQLMALYSVNDKLLTPVPSRIGIVDDVLTLGAHFRAMKQVLLNRFPDLVVVGFFIARRVHAV